MPGRNLEKIYLDDAYYHVYSRGVNKRLVFRDNEDFRVFTNLCKRYLGEQPEHNLQGRQYPWFGQQIELLAYCLMPNHFHAIIYQSSAFAITNFFRSLITSYGMYFNKKYHRVGPVFQSRIRAALITEDVYLQHVSRYVHLNPKDYDNWAYSSLPYYKLKRKADWLKTQKILDLFDSRESYLEFVADYKDFKTSLDSTKSELANF